jgi:hypothetical protein
MDDDFFRGDLEPAARGHDNLFAWTIFILLLIGLALACWLGSFYIFGHPENPRSYSLLKKLHKIEPPRRFDLTAAPAGEFLTAQKLYERYILFSRYELEHENQQLLRNYISNYQETNKLVTYVIGTFSILDSFELKNGDMFSTGVVALAQAGDFPQLLIEHLYTSEAENVPVLRRMLMTGLDLKLEKSLDLSAVIHVERLADGKIQLTLVPLLYGSYALKQGSGTFNLQPPEELNLTPGAPIVRGELRQEALRTFADFRRGKPAEVAEKTSASPTPSQAAIVRAEVTPAPVASPTATIIAKASPAVSPKQVTLAKALPIPSVAPKTTPVEVAVLATPATAIATPRAVSPTPLPAAPKGVTLQPFLAAAATPALPNAVAGSWKTFKPGQMPRGRVVDPREATDLAGRGVAGERLYLRGEFRVTAAGENRAVLRVPGADATRIIAEFPAGANAPGEGQTISRDENRPFQVTDIRRGADGQVNVYVREIISE